MDGGSVKAWSKEIQGKLSYSNSAWTLYENLGGDYHKVESIELSVMSLNSYVTFRYSYVDPMVIIAGWFNTVKFAEGEQFISAQIPSKDYAKD